jgi:hypothetical protein
LQIAAMALAAVGITMNGWFARSFGSTDTAGWLFLVIGADRRSRCAFDRGII